MKVSKYFLYTLLYVCVIALVYSIGWFMSNDVNWIVNNWSDTPRQKGNFLRLILMTNVLYVLFRMLISTYKQ
jgi:hypothetical protein